MNSWLQFLWTVLRREFHRSNFQNLSILSLFGKHSLESRRIKPTNRFFFWVVAQIFVKSYLICVVSPVYTNSYLFLSVAPLITNSYLFWIVAPLLENSSLFWVVAPLITNSSLFWVDTPVSPTATYFESSLQYLSKATSNWCRFALWNNGYVFSDFSSDFPHISMVVFMCEIMSISFLCFSSEALSWLYQAQTLTHQSNDQGLSETHRVLCSLMIAWMLWTRFWSILVSSGQDCCFFVVLCWTWLQQQHDQGLEHARNAEVYEYCRALWCLFWTFYAFSLSFCLYCRRHDLIFVPSVGPGYDDSKIRPWNTQNTHRRMGGRYYDTQVCVFHTWTQ